MKSTLLLIGILFLAPYTYSQKIIEQDSLVTGVKMISNVTRQQEKASNAILREQKKWLDRLDRQEGRILKKLRGADSAAAAIFEAGMGEKKHRIEKILSSPLENRPSRLPYIPRIDSLEIMLKWLAPVSGKKDELEKALGSVGDLKGRILQADEIKSLLTERQQALRSMLSPGGLLDGLPIKGLDKSISRYSKDVYYYKASISNLKETFKDPGKLEKEVLRLAGKVPAFREFMRQNSQLSQMFGPGLPDGAAIAGPVSAGLQTRNSVTQLLQQQLGQAGVNPQQFLQQQLGAASKQLANAREKLEALRNGGNGGEADMPDFKPNSQKVKPFLKRLEYGFNLQSGNKGAYDFPASNDLGISLGYKLNDRLAAGVGLAYRFGLGKGWKDIDLTHEGVGFRSYVDWKLSAQGKGMKVLFGNIWLSGGFEQNYMHRFRNIDALRGVAWQTSGLVGVSRKIQYKKRGAKVSALWDFMSRSRSQSQPFVFRYGYTF